MVFRHMEETDTKKYSMDPVAAFTECGLKQIEDAFTAHEKFLGLPVGKDLPIRNPTFPALVTRPSPKTSNLYLVVLRPNYGAKVRNQPGFMLHKALEHATTLNSLTTDRNWKSGSGISSSKCPMALPIPFPALPIPGPEHLREDAQARRDQRVPNKENPG